MSPHSLFRALLLSSPMLSAILRFLLPFFSPTLSSLFPYTSLLFPYTSLLFPYTSLLFPYTFLSFPLHFPLFIPGPSSSRRFTGPCRFRGACSTHTAARVAVTLSQLTRARARARAHPSRTRRHGRCCSCVWCCGGSLDSCFEEEEEYWRLN